MKVLNISKNGTIKCEMSDGRLGYTYKSGYVRVSLKGGERRKKKLYQINTKRKNMSANGINYYYTRELVFDKLKQLQMLHAFDLKNCQPKNN